MKIKTLFACMMFSSVAMAYDDFSTSTSYSDASRYSDNIQLRSERKIGVGTHMGGTAGLVGAHLDMSLDGTDGVLVGLGLGEGFSTYSLAWKRNYIGSYFTPYTTLGWSRWVSSGSRTPDSYMLSSTLSKNDLNSGRFNADFITGSVGAQYQQLDGEFTGASLFAEVGLFIAPAKGRTTPAASVGATYFF